MGENAGCLSHNVAIQPMKFNPTLPELILLCIISFGIYLWAQCGKRVKRWWENLSKRHRGPQTLRPREPGDCPACAQGYHRLPRRLRQDVVPWSEMKSPRGREKRVDTRGYACLNIWCAYFGVTDPAIHALVSNGWRGKTKISCSCADNTAENARPAGWGR